MNEEIPHSVVSGRRVAMVLLVLAMLITVAAALWLVAVWATQPVVV
jgi:hypothetical protein